MQGFSLAGREILTIYKCRFDILMRDRCGAFMILA